jgi:C-terminal processing protease CtpA/Prc
VRQFWTLPYVPGIRFGSDKPVYVLTSQRTFSGGEELAYDLQQLGRAVIVGETTGGGAHARRGFRLTDHLEAHIPVARALNPHSGRNWEGTGVAPDVAIEADQALDAALRLAQETLA